MAKLRVGIVGAGNISALHALTYEQDERAQIVAVCDTNEDAAIKRSLEWGAQRYYTDFDDLVNDPDIDAIEILTPNHLHAAYAIKALEAGKHVSVERPIALSPKDAEQVIQTAERVQRVLHVYEPCLFYKPLLDAHHLIKAGEIGTVTAIHFDAVIGKSLAPEWNIETLASTDAWRFNMEQVGGTPMLYDVGYQALCMALFLVGTSIERVNVWTGKTQVGPYTLDAPTTAMWKHFQQDLFGSLSLTYAPDRVMNTEYYPLEFNIRVSGTRGDVHVSRGGDPTSMSPPVELDRGNRRVAYGQNNTTYTDSFVRAGQNFIGACLGQEEPLLRGLEAKQLLVLSTAYFESARRGRDIPLQHG